jgi:DMSO/TMAO reductase YedYZ molybdopterin-dependent catalytic subunit
MNGQELPKEHGHPLRLIVPGWYGMASVKWLRKITVLDTDYAGYFQDYKYVIEDEVGHSVPLTTIGVKSLIGMPSDNETVSMGQVCVTGMAWSGQERIDRVDFSSDDGATWDSAEIIGPSEKYAWQKWHYTWSPAAPGDYTLMSRAVDVRGNVQPMKTRWNRLGYMVNGVKPVCVTVVS